MQHQKILILDFGSQVTQLIARRIREAHVFCEVHSCDVSDDWLRAYARDGMLKGIILWAAMPVCTKKARTRLRNQYSNSEYPC